MLQLIPVAKYQGLNTPKCSENAPEPAGAGCHQRCPAAAAAAPAVQHRPLTAPLLPKSSVCGAAQATLAKNHGIPPATALTSLRVHPVFHGGTALQGSSHPQPSVAVRLELG